MKDRFSRTKRAEVELIPNVPQACDITDRRIHGILIDSLIDSVLHVIMNWLRVFSSVEVSRSGHGESQQLHTGGVKSEKCVARHGGCRTKDA